MSEVYDGANVPFVYSFTIPDDGDDVDATSVNTAFQPMADNWARASLSYPDLYSGGTYTGAPYNTKTVTIGLAALVFTGPVKISATTLSIESGGLLEVKGGTTLQIDSAGLVDVKNNAVLQIDAGGSISYVVGGVVTGFPLHSSHTSAGTSSGANKFTIDAATKAWAWIAVDGAGGWTVMDNVNVSAVAIAGTQGLRLTFAQSFANANFCVVGTVTDKNSGVGAVLTETHAGRLSSQVTVAITDLSAPGAYVDLVSGGVAFHVNVMVTGRQ